jgi:endoglucanase
MLKVKNLDGSTTGLYFDVHKYLDSDNSGTHAECVTDVRILQRSELLC